jgi:hypothetical protein
MPSLRAFLKQVERQQITIALEMAPCPRVAAANLGLSYEALRKAANKHGLYLNRLRRQRGFIGGIYVYLAMALAAAALAAVCYLTGRSDGRSLERSEWTEQQNSDLRTANQAIDAAHKKAREQEAQSAQKVAAVSTAYQKDLANANRAKDLALNALRAGSLVLRDPGTASRNPDADRAGEAAACTARPDGGAPGQLSEPLTRFLVDLASEADQLAGQLAGCQAVVRADRGG